MSSGRKLPLPEETEGCRSLPGKAARTLHDPPQHEKVETWVQGSESVHRLPLLSVSLTSPAYWVRHGEDIERAQNHDLNLQDSEPSLQRRTQVCGTTRELAPSHQAAHGKPHGTDQ